MNRILLSGATIVAVAALVAPAGAAPPPTQKLQREVTTLQTQVKTLQKQVQELRAVTALALALDVCSVAVTADAVQGTWNVVDQIAQATQAGKVYFGAQQPLSDLGACDALSVKRATLVPPNVAVFNALLSIFK